MKPLRALVGIALSALLIWWTLRGESPAEIWSVLRTGNPWLLAASVAVATSGFLLRAMRWRVLLLPVRSDTKLRSRFAAVTIGFMANNLLPARVGEFVRVYAFSRMEPVSLSAGLGSLVVERLLDGVVLVCFLLLPPLLPGFPAGGAGEGTLGTLLKGVLLVFAVLFAVLAVLLIWPARVVGAAERLFARLPRGGGRRAVDALASFLDALQVLRRPSLLLAAVLWSFAFWTWHGLSFFLGMAAFGIHEGFLAAIFTEAVVGFGVALPSAPGFIGTFHASAAWALEGVYGVEAARSLAFAYGYHLGGFFPVTFIGLWYARQIGLSFKDLGKSEEAVESAVEETHPEAAALLARAVGSPPDGSPEPGLALEIEAPAKVNLVLRVLAREASGYHRIETLLQAVSLSDTLRVEATAAPGVTLEVSGMDLGPAEQNLAYRAARAFLDAPGAGRGGVRIHLEKRIPAGAGLGGGSSDAAATLRALDALLGPLPPGALHRIAAALGSDVPFFLGPSPLALGEGRGERLRALPPLPAAPVVLALPAVHVATPGAYGELARRRADEGSPPPRAPLPAEALDWGAVAGLAENDFEAVVPALHPEIRAARQALETTGARFVLLSGSGSAVFALYPEGTDTSALLRALPPVPRVSFVEARTLDAFPAPRRMAAAAGLLTGPPGKSPGGRG